MYNQNMKRRVAVRAIIVKDGKLLCVKLKPYKTAMTGDFWCTVGGGVDSEEGLVPAIKREVLEETGMTPTVGNLLYIQQYSNETREELEFFFHITNADDFLNIDLSKTTHGEEEIAEIKFIDTAKETILPKFLSEQDFTNLDKQYTTFFNYL